MANPFPGMDPYLEGDLWTSVHLDLSAEIVRILAPQVRPKYYVLSGHRFSLVAEEANGSGGQRLPDVGVVGTDAASASGVAPAAVAAPFVSPADLADAELEVTIEVYDRRERRLVTALEVLSPSNKQLPGMRKYVAKRQYFMHSSAHFLEIDLLRAGRRFPVTDPPPVAPYYVFLSRTERRPDTEIWPIPLEAPLPTIPVPLLPGDTDATIDLNRALTTVYEVVGFDGLIDYTRPPPGPLTPEQAAWIDHRLREAGRRP